MLWMQVHAGKAHYLLGEMTEAELAERYNLNQITVVDITGRDVQVGDDYDEQTGEFSRPPAPTPEEIEAAAWVALRAERNRRLLASDWTQLPDVPLTSQQKQMWAAYRQALRDLPENTADPNNPVWPEAPA